MPAAAAYDQVTWFLVLASHQRIEFLGQTPLGDHVLGQCVARDLMSWSRQ